MERAVMRQTLRIVVTLLLVSGLAGSAGLLRAQGSRAAEAALKAAQHTEEVGGDLPAAIKQYQAVVDKYGKTDRAVAAQAQLRIGQCYERLGNAQWRKAYEKVVSDFADQKDLVAQAQSRLAALGQEPGRLMIQLLKTKFDPDTGKVVGAPSFVSPRGGLSRSPSFSGDGRWLAYIWQDQELMIQSVESGEERAVRMTPSPVSLNWAVMFPDAQSILVKAVHPKDATGNFGFYIVNATSGAWTSLAKPGEPEVTGHFLGISPDGRTVYYNTAMPAPPRLLARDIDTGHERELGVGPGNRLFALSHDGKALAVVRRDGKDLAIDVLPATGGPKREIYRVQGFQEADVTWTPDGRYLIFAPGATLTDSKTYMRIPASGGEAQPIGISVSQNDQVQFPRSLAALRVHPSGRLLVYTGRGTAGATEVPALLGSLLKAPK
jgi:Tol biopolymer transport system component